jgi:limonene-1,2-epoxide hydrolase
MSRRTLAAALVLPLLALFACGGGDSASTPTVPSTVSGDANPQDVQVINAWSTALRQGDVTAAANYFAIPSTAENGPLLARIRSTDDAVSFNESLPCGARLVHAESTAGFTTATFRLTERPGPGSCGLGAGTLARTSFVIRDGKIAQWRRVGRGSGGGSAPRATA